MITNHMAGGVGRLNKRDLFYIFIGFFLLLALSGCGEKTVKLGKLEDFFKQSLSLFMKPKKKERTVCWSDRPRLAILPFTMSGGDQRYVILERSLPELLAAGLITNPNVETVSFDCFYQSALSRYTINELRVDPLLAYSDEILKSLKVELVLKGSYVVYDRKIRLDAQLYDTEDNRVGAPINSVVFSDSRIFDAIIGVSDTLSAEITSATTKSTGIKKVGVLCFEQQAGMGRELGRNVAMTLIPYITPGDHFAVLPWSDTKAYCPKSHQMQPGALSEKLETDALLTGTIELIDEKYRIMPSVYIHSSGKTLDLQPIEGDYFVSTNQLIEDVNLLFQAIIDKNGNWLIDPLTLVNSDYRYYLTMGNSFLYEKDNPYMAILLYQYAFQLNNEDNRLFLGFGQSWLKMGNATKAEVAFKKALKLKPDSVEALIGLGEMYLKLNKTVDARKYYHEALEIVPARADLKFSLGRIEYMNKQYDTALEYFEAVLNQRPVDSTLSIYLENTLLLARSYRSLGENGKAQNILLSELERYPGNPRILALLEKIYFQNGLDSFRKKHFDKAVVEFENAKNIQPSPVIYVKLIDSLNKQEKFDIAVEVFKEAEKKDAVDAFVWNSFGWSLYGLGEFQLASEVFTSAALANKEDASVHYNNLGWVLDKMEKYNEAIEAYNKAIESNPRYAKAYNNKAYDLLRLGRFKEARSAAQSAVSYAPTYYRAYNNLGFSLYHLGEKDEAIQSLKQSVRLAEELKEGENTGPAYYRLAWIYAKEGDQDNALFYLKRAVSTNDSYREKVQDDTAFEKLNKNLDYQLLIFP